MWSKYTPITVNDVDEALDDRKQNNTWKNKDQAKVKTAKLFEELLPRKKLNRKYDANQCKNVDNDAGFGNLTLHDFNDELNWVKRQTRHDVGPDNDGQQQPGVEFIPVLFF